MELVIHITKLVDHTHSRHSGKKCYEKIVYIINEHNDKRINRILLDFSDVESVSSSFIQETLVKLHDNEFNVEFMNANKSVLRKLYMLVQIFETDPSVFRRASHPPQEPLYA